MKTVPRIIPFPLIAAILGFAAMAFAQNEKKATPDLKKKLTPIQYSVTQESGTEPAFHNEYWDNHSPGIYVSVVSGEPLFSSLDKFDSGTGWPSFSKPISESALKQHTDTSLGMDRMEIRSAKADTHLGHLFDDGPAPSHMRYCINSAALRFIPAEKLVAAGFPDLAETFKKKDASK